MTIIDKNGVLESIEGKSLDFGCGAVKRYPDYVGVDALDYDTVDIVGDAFDVLEAIPDASIRAIYSEHFLEHIADVERMLAEFARVLQQDGTLDIIVPHFSNPYYFSDLTHKAIFGLYSLAYFSDAGYFRRTVPNYQRNFQFRLAGVRLGFKSARPFYGRHAVKTIIGKMVNLSRYTQEFYEENLAYIMPCYEIQYTLKKK